MVAFIFLRITTHIRHTSMNCASMQMYTDIYKEKTDRRFCFTNKMTLQTQIQKYNTHKHTATANFWSLFWLFCLFQWNAWTKTFANSLHLLFLSHVVPKSIQSFIHLLVCEHCLISRAIRCKPTTHFAMWQI